MTLQDSSTTTFYSGFKMLRNIICTLLFMVCMTKTFASMGDTIRNECDHLQISVLKGHYLLTGVTYLDNETCQRYQSGEAICDIVQMRKNRDEIMGLFLRQLRVQLKDMYGIDCSSDFYAPPSESDRILLSEARRQIDIVIAQGLRYSDPAFAALVIERALFAQESPQTAMMNLIKSISGLPQVESNFNGAANLLTCALLGNTVAAQSAWQDGRFPIDWKLSYSELEKRSAQQSKEIQESNLNAAAKESALKRVRDIQTSIETFGTIRSLPFQYLYARSIFIDTTFNDQQKMDILAGMDTGASLDYWGILYYAQLVKNTKPGTETIFSNENAVTGWHTYFANAMHRPLSQYFAVRPLLKKDGRPLPRGYIDGLYAFAEMQSSEPFHLVLRSLITKTNGKQIEKTAAPSKATELAKAYLINYLYCFSETKDLNAEETSRFTAEFNGSLHITEIRNKIRLNLSSLSDTKQFSERQIEQINKELLDRLLRQFLANRLNERKIAEIRAIGEIVPEAKDILALAIHEEKLGYDDQAPTQRREALYDLAVDNVQAAQDLLITDYVTEFSSNPESLNLLGNIYYFAFKGNIKAQKLLTEKSGELPSLLQLHLAFNLKKGITPFRDRQTDINNEAHNLLRYAFKIIKILTQPHDFSGTFVNFFDEAKRFIEKTENA